MLKAGFSIEEHAPQYLCSAIHLVPSSGKQKKPGANVLAPNLPSKYRVYSQSTQYPG
jgi:hypothetical protein